MSLLVYGDTVIKGQTIIGQYIIPSVTFNLFQTATTASYIFATGETPIGVSLSSLPGNSLIVVTIGTSNDANEVSQTLPSMSSNPSLTWNYGTSSHIADRPNTAIYYANYPDGGNISITGSWGSAGQTYRYITAYVFENAVTGSKARKTGQEAPTIDITTTADNSYVVLITNDWFPQDGSTRVYRNLPITEVSYFFYTAKSTNYNYYKQTTTASTYTLGVSTPADQWHATLAIEIKSA